MCFPFLLRVLLRDTPSKEPSSKETKRGAAHRRQPLKKPSSKETKSGAANLLGTFFFLKRFAPLTGRVSLTGLLYATYLQSVPCLVCSVPYRRPVRGDTKRIGRDTRSVFSFWCFLSKSVFSFYPNLPLVEAIKKAA